MVLMGYSGADSCKTRSKKSRNTVPSSKIKAFDKTTTFKGFATFFRPESFYASPAGQLHPHRAVQQPRPLLQPALRSFFRHFRHFCFRLVAQVLQHFRHDFLLLPGEVHEQQLHREQDAVEGQR
jgi:hypothetical protein